MTQMQHITTQAQAEAPTAEATAWETLPRRPMGRKERKNSKKAFFSTLCVSFGLPKCRRSCGLLSKPGDSMSMTCTKCKSVRVQKVTADKAHVKMMTVGEKVMCHACDGTAEVVATGKGEGENAEVKHVCSKCGDDAMFCSAVKPGSGAMKDMPMDKK